MQSNRISLIHALAAALALGAAATAAAANGDSNGRHLIFLPSATADAPAITAAFTDQGFNVHTLHLAPRDRATQARTVAREVRALMSAGVAAEDISVVGPGDLAVLASAAAGSAGVNYVLLGHCNVSLKHAYRFRPAGHVLGIRDSADPASHSCRALWQDAPRVRERRDLVVDTGQGAALFDTPQAAWMEPAVTWASRGTVKIGEVKVSQVERAALKPHAGG